MGSISKHSLNSETSSEESDHQPEKFKEDNTGVGRFYECNFCKRGFTNAQALGGHMNIHRKDRAKTRQKTSKSSFSNKSEEECMNPRYFEHLSGDDQQYSVAPIGGQMNYQFCVPTANPNFSLGCDHRHHLSDPVTLRKEQISLFEDHKTANLSMQIDDYSDHQEDSESKSTSSRENELDLELRLG